jgi:hypothetical protein
VSLGWRGRRIEIEASRWKGIAVALTIPNHQVVDEPSFAQATADPRQIAAAYFYLELDCLVTLAHKVACDFFRRAHLYTAPSRETAAQLARLRAQYGNDERVPSQAQRDEIFQPLFGRAGGDAGNGHGDFPRLRDDLVDAATAFAERVFDTGVEMLRERVRTTHRPLKDYLVGLQGDSLAWSTEEALAGVARGLAYAIERNAGVNAVFGISTPPRVEWPFVEDSNADKLIEEIARQLLSSGNGAAAMTREGFSSRQRAALRGTEALATVLDFSENGSDEDLDLLITKVYTWGSALKSLRPAAAPAPAPVMDGEPQPTYTG